MATQTILTLTQFENLAEDGNLHEVSEGALVSLTHPKYRHMAVSHKVLRALQEFLTAHPIGEAYIEMAYLLAEDLPTLRVPDVSFLRSERLSGVGDDEYLRGAPDLAVEVVSPSNPKMDLEQQVRQYQTGGVAFVWVVYPERRSVDVFDAVRKIATLHEGDTLEAPSLFPGWSVPVAGLF